MSGNFESYRREYTAGGLTAEDLCESPIAQFERWLEQSVNAGLSDPTAMALSTIDGAGQPWQRIVLLKGLSDDGFVFYTNFGSDKAKAMDANDKVSLLFPWNELDRQVIVGGTAKRMSLAESATYFLSRPRESQIAAWASRQSRPIAKRALLEAEVRKLRGRFAEGEVPVPDFWGGYRIQPERIEFWQGGEHRLHDRFRYERGGDGGWQVTQLQP
ncbi:pyridoxamine 5'-phosphate oxidase [Congregibacter litoralis]|uniref:Pyridoxine/pyridoxamine 5'-phosphate oxidase n=1 Tax=Congregibacter litoralis KT71 TaxID=314285 RepID=A4A6M2_9GAMM|nr:pyridoxamine 5'-phosphate oxidase [Congregibacter litoralis]EAQ98669.1 Pyridoxamine 5''-phosphate oxidase [Congregibacter litoralis KT71]